MKENTVRFLVGFLAGLVAFTPAAAFLTRLLWIILT